MTAIGELNAGPDNAATYDDVLAHKLMAEIIAMAAESQKIDGESRAKILVRARNRKSLECLASVHADIADTLAAARDFRSYLRWSWLKTYDRRWDTEKLRTIAVRGLVILGGSGLLYMYVPTVVEMAQKASQLLLK